MLRRLVRPPLEFRREVRAAKLQFVLEVLQLDGRDREGVLELSAAQLGRLERGGAGVQLADLQPHRLEVPAWFHVRSYGIDTYLNPHVVDLRAIRSWRDEERIIREMKCVLESMVKREFVFQ